MSAESLVREALSKRRHGAFRESNDEAALTHARRADGAIRQGDYRGVLHGIPYSMKDLFGFPGYAIHAGASKALPPQFRQAGPMIAKTDAMHAIPIGKTHTVEFAFGGIGTNPNFKTPQNPVDPLRAPGGSSAGAGVSIVEGSSLFAFGTDTAGSVRIPASWTGCVGLKTTVGRWSTKGVVPLSTTLDTVGILAGSVDDIAAVFSAIDGEKAEAMSCAELKFGRLTSLFEGCDRGIVECVDGALCRLEAAGATIVDVRLDEIDDALELLAVGGPASAELYAFLRRHLPTHLAELDPNVRHRIGDAGKMNAADYLDRLAILNRLATSAASRIAEVDIWVAPTVCSSPPLIAELNNNADYYRQENMRALRNTSIASYLGLCAMTVPIGRDAIGMPVGLELIAPAMQDAALIEIGRAVEDKLA